MGNQPEKQLVNTSRVVTALVITILVAWISWTARNVATCQDLAPIMADIKQNRVAIGEIQVMFQKFLKSQQQINEQLSEKIAGHTLEISEVNGEIRRLRDTQQLQINHIQQALNEIQRILSKDGDG